MMEYLNFDLEISPKNDAFYPVVARSEAGEARHQMLFPLEGLALDHALLQVQNALLRAGNVRRGAGTPEEQTVERFGQMLFEALVGPRVRRLYDTSMGRASQQDKGVRVRLNIQAPELATLPWEFLYDPDQHEYLCFLPHLVLVRYLEIARPPLPLKVEPPLRVLAMIAEPDNQARLNVTEEQQRLEKALSPLAQQGLVNLHWVPGQTADDLHAALLQEGWHCFHFIGHGAFDPRHQEGVLALVDKQGHTDLRSATNLGRMLAQHRSLRLVVLNACQGAAGNRHDLFSSTAATFAGKGIPAVLAMQYDITDQAAIAFTRGFYGALAVGTPVDGAVTQARTAISAGMARTLEWVTPVLYLRAPTGTLFEVPRPPSGSWASWEAPLPHPSSPEASIPFLPVADAAGPAKPPLDQPDVVTPGSAPAWEGFSPAGVVTPNPPASMEGPSQKMGAAPTERGEASPRGDSVHPPSAAPAPLPTPSEATNQHQGGSGPQSFVPPPSPAPGADVPPLGAHGPGPQRKRPRVWRVLMILVLLLVLVGSGLEVAHLAGNGSLAPQTQQRATGTSQPAITTTPEATVTVPEATATTLPATAIPKPVGIVHEFALPNGSSEPLEITAGPDGNLWFTECNFGGSGADCTDSKIGRMTPSGQVTEFNLPNSPNDPQSITTGPDGNLWFTACNLTSSSDTCTIGQITPQGTITEFPLLSSSDFPATITAGPDGNLWFTNYNATIGRITPQGMITEFPLPDADSTAIALTHGPDGNLWFPECVFSLSNSTCSLGKIGRITPTGKFTEYALPNPTSYAGGIIPGSDGNLWFPECVPNASGSQCSNSKIGRITPAGKFTEYVLSNSTCYPDSITAGPDGNLWFSEYASKKIGRITPQGISSEFSLPNTRSGLSADTSALGEITTGPDGNLWFIIGNRIGQITSGK